MMLVSVLTFTDFYHITAYTGSLINFEVRADMTEAHILTMIVLNILNELMNIINLIDS